MNRVVMILDIDGTSFKPKRSVEQSVCDIYRRKIPQPDKYGLEFYPYKYQKFIDSLYRSKGYMCDNHRPMAFMQTCILMLESVLKQRDCLFEVKVLSHRYESIYLDTLRMIIKHSAIFPVPVNLVYFPKDKHEFVKFHFSNASVIWVDDNPVDLDLANRYEYITIKSNRKWNADVNCDFSYNNWISLIPKIPTICQALEAKYAKVQ